eukprot:751534-Hanusia_phi.AAC.5
MQRFQVNKAIPPDEIPSELWPRPRSFSLHSYYFNHQKSAFILDWLVCSMFLYGNFRSMRYDSCQPVPFFPLDSASLLKHSPGSPVVRLAS